MDFSFGFGLGSSAYLLSGYNPYNPLINYDWSTTTTSGLRYLKDVGSTPTYNASMYFGRGAYLNGVDQTITVPINTTIQTSLKRVNGIVTINETSQTLTNYVISGLGVHKDYYLFTRLLRTAEKDSYTNTSEAFYAMAQADSTCVLNMPMCETSSTVRNYKTGINYPITNYTSSVRDNAKNLQYGLQTCKFVRNSLGVIQSSSNYLEADGVGNIDSNWLPSTNPSAETIEIIFKLIKYSGYKKVMSVNQNNNMLIQGLNGTPSYVIYYRGLRNATTSQSENSYVHVVMTCNNTTSTIYINGVNIKSGAKEIMVVNSLKLGANDVGTDQYGGPIRLFKVHNKALTNEEIQAL